MIMKIDAIVREEKFEDVKNALMDIEVNGLTVSQVMGCGLQRGYKEIVRGVRNVRSEMNVPNSRKATIYVVCEDEKLVKGLAVLKESAMMMASAGDFIVQADKSGIADDAVSVVVPDATVYVPLEELIDFEQEKERLTKEETRLNKEIARSNGMLNNEKFVSKAPAAKVQEEREKLEKYEQMLAQVKERLAGLQKK